MLSRKNSPLGKNRSKKDPYLVFSSVSELKSHPLFAHLGEEWTKNEGLFYMKIEKKVKQPTACQNRNGEMFRGSEILGAHLNIFIELNIDDFPLLLDCIINKRFSSNVKQNGLYFRWGGFSWYSGSLLNITMVSKNILP